MSNVLLKKLLTLVPLTATGPEVYVAIVTTFIFNSYDTLEDTLNSLKNLKLKRYPEDNVIDFYEAILVGVDSLESVSGTLGMRT